MTRELVTEQLGLWSTSLDRCWLRAGYDDPPNAREWGDHRGLWDRIGIGDLLDMDSNRMW